MEDTDISKVRKSRFSYRAAFSEIEELSRSIAEKGLLQPLVVRAKEDYFEIVAGNRRFEACKALGWRKVFCHIIELTDKEAFEISLIENIQRNSIDPLDEAHAFEEYVIKLGWGGISELARKIGKSINYVDRRLRLLNLPADVLSSVASSDISSSLAEELLSIKDGEIQSEFARLAKEKRMSSRKVRELVKEYQSESPYSTDDISSFYSRISNIDETSQRAFDKSIIVLRLAVRKLNKIIEDVEDSWIVRETLGHHRIILNEQIDLLIKEKKKI